MTTRSGARVYRGQGPQRAAADACPTCHKPVKLTPTGRRGRHKDPDGGDCTGGGVMVGGGRVVEVDPDVAAEVMAGVDAYVRAPANRWSGKP